MNATYKENNPSSTSKAKGSAVTAASGDGILAEACGRRWWTVWAVRRPTTHRGQAIVPKSVSLVGDVRSVVARGCGLGERTVRPWLPKEYGAALSLLIFLVIVVDLNWFMTSRSSAVLCSITPLASRLITWRMIRFEV